METADIVRKLIRKSVIPFTITMVIILIISIVFHAAFQAGVAYQEFKQLTEDRLIDKQKVILPTAIQVDRTSIRISYLIALSFAVLTIGVFLADIANRDSMLMVLIDIICAILSSIAVLLIVRLVCLSAVYIGYYLITGSWFGYVRVNLFILLILLWPTY